MNDPRYHRIMTSRRVGLLAAMFVLVGCTAAGPSAIPASSRPTPSFELASQQPTEVPGASLTPAPDSGGVPSAIIEAVKIEIADDAGLTPRDVTIVSSEAVTFADGSLDCPMPGVNYIQVQVDGFIVVGMAGGTTFDYRGTSPTDLRRCEKPR